MLLFINGFIHTIIWVFTFLHIFWLALVLISFIISGTSIYKNDMI